MEITNRANLNQVFSWGMWETSTLLGRNADFTGAKFDGASIYGFIDQKTAPTTVFDEAILTGTSWDEAYIHTGVQFEGAKFDGSTFTGATGEGGGEIVLVL